MKRSNLKYFIAATLVAAGVTAVSMYSCEKENITPTGQVQMDYEKLAEPDQPSGPAVCGEVERKQILLENGKSIGVAYCYNDTKKFHVVMITQADFYMGDVFMDVCENFNDLPLDSNKNPLISSFTYTIQNQRMSNVRMFNVDLSEMSGNSFVTAVAHVRQMAKDKTFPSKFQKAWIGGKYFGDTERGRVFTYTKGTCTENTEVGLPAEEM